MLKRITAMLMTVFCFCNGVYWVSAENFEGVKEGSYIVQAELSCYVNAMGGVEFGAPLLTAATVTIEADGSKSMTLSFTKSSVTIYSVTCDTFIDVTPSYVTDSNGVKSGTLGYYDDGGVLVTEGVSYTLSEDTALNARQEQVHYADSMTFPLTEQSSTYQLSLYVNSNVMGTQFTMDGYPAVLTVDWSRMEAENSTPAQNPATEEVASVQNPGTEEVASVQSEMPSERAEKKESLSIYSADEVQPAEAGTTEEAETTAAVSMYQPVLAGTSVLAVVMILAGIAMLALGRKEKTKCEN